jgi:hypothetical protein
VATGAGPGPLAKRRVGALAMIPFSGRQRLLVLRCQISCSSPTRHAGAMFRLTRSTNSIAGRSVRLALRNLKWYVLSFGAACAIQTEMAGDVLADARRCPARQCAKSAFL